MSNGYDFQYEDLLADVFQKGRAKSDRTGVGTRSMFGTRMEFDLQHGFPLITTKRVYTRPMITELLWFLSGDTNNKTLTDQNVHIWDEWAREDGSLGPVYGHQWRSWTALDYDIDANGYRELKIDQMNEVLRSLANNPNSRRHIVSAWNVGDLPFMALAPCHALFQFDVTGDELNLQLYQRSADMFLGVPFNIASYALLQHMVAHQLSYEVGRFIWVGGDTHVYDNHHDQVTEQLRRSLEDEPYPYPTLKINRPKGTSIFDYKVEDFEFQDYQYHPAIKAPVAV